MSYLPSGKEVYGNEMNEPYSYRGQGASPLKALLFEALTNRVGSFNQGMRNVPFDSLIKNKIFPIDPSFAGQDYSGSGSYYISGPYGGNIIMNRNRNLLELLREKVFQHEGKHREAGGMGGLFNGNEINPFLQRFDNYILQHEEPWRLPGERLAAFSKYPQALTRAKTKYYLPGDFRRALAGYE